MTDTTQKPPHVVAHELLTGKKCVYTTVGEHLRLGGFPDWYTEDLTSRVPRYDLTEEEYTELIRLLQQTYYHERTGEILTDPEAIAVDAWFDCDREKWPRVDRVLGVRYLKESYDTYEETNLS